MTTQQIERRENTLAALRKAAEIFSKNPDSIQYGSCRLICDKEPFEFCGMLRRKVSIRMTEHGGACFGQCDDELFRFMLDNGLSLSAHPDFEERNFSVVADIFDFIDIENAEDYPEGFEVTEH